jgi:anti-anti-sigma factor
VSYQLDLQGTLTQVFLSGELCFDAHATIRNILNELDNQTTKGPVVFCMSDVRKIDPAGLGLLLIANTRLRDRGFSLKAPSPEVDHVLSLTRFTTLVPCA